MLIIINAQQAKDFLYTNLGVAAFELLPAPLRKVIENFSINDEADFLKLLSYLEARSQSNKSEFSDQHKKISEAIHDYCSQRDSTSIASPFNPQQSLYQCRRGLSLSPDIKHLPSMDYKRKELPYKDRFKFWLGYKAAGMKVTTDKASHRFDEIVDHIYLGMMPNVKLAGKLLDAFKSKTNGRSAVVSTLQEYELFGDGAMQLDHANYFWHNQDVHHFLLPMQDHSVEFESKNPAAPQYSVENINEILETLDALNKLYQQNGSLYFHCKAGQGRSSFMLILFLCLFYKPLQATDNEGNLDIDMTIEKVHTHVCKVRKQVDSNNSYRTQGLKILIQEYLQRQQQVKANQENNDDDGSDPDAVVDDHKDFTSAANSPR
jgi:hypothetical protein